MTADSETNGPEIRYENFFTKRSSPIKDIAAGVTHKATLPPGETLNTGANYATQFLEISTHGQKPSRESTTQITLAGVPDTGVRADFYVGVGQVPVFVNEGTAPFHVYATTQEDRTTEHDDGYGKKNGLITVEPGKSVNLVPQGGNNYYLLWQAEGKDVTVAFRNSGTDNHIDTDVCFITR